MEGLVVVVHLLAVLVAAAVEVFQVMQVQQDPMAIQALLEM
jgi:hypothetical protein